MMKPIDRQHVRLSWSVRRLAMKTNMGCHLYTLPMHKISHHSWN